MKRFLTILALFILTAIPAMAFNSKPTGVAYSDPNLTELWLNGAGGFTAMRTKSLTTPAGISVGAYSSNVATYSVSGLTTSDALYWIRTSTISDSASKSLIVENMRVSTSNILEVTTVNASASAVVTPAMTFKILAIH